MKNKFLLVVFSFILLGCDTFTELATENKNNQVNSEKVFKGNRVFIHKLIKDRYSADFVSLGIVGFWSDKWIQVSIHNGVELSEAEEMHLAKAIYSQMDTSFVSSRHIVVSQSSEKGFILTKSAASSREYYYHELDPNIPNQELEHEDRNLMESWRVGL